MTVVLSCAALGPCCDWRDASLYTDFPTALAEAINFCRQHRLREENPTSQGQSQIIFFKKCLSCWTFCFPFSCIASLVSFHLSGTSAGGRVLSPCVPTSRVSVAFRSKPSRSPTPNRRLSFSFFVPFKTHPPSVRNYLPPRERPHRGPGLQCNQCNGRNPGT